MKLFTYTKKSIFFLIQILILIVIFIFVVNFFEERFKKNATTKQSTIKINKELTLVDSSYDTNANIVNYHGFTLSYLPKFKLSNYVSYPLTKTMINGKFKRTDNFLEDPNVRNSQKLEPYRRSGYDRGHLAPAADMSYSEDAMRESFYMSNMTPQVPEFNRGIWSQLESTVRNFANKEGLIYVVTGPLLYDFKAYLKKGTKDEIPVPKYFYKVILKEDGDNSKAIAFLLENKDDNNTDLKKYVTTVDKIEELTDLDFFYKLNDEIENMVESKSNPSLWKFSEFKKSSSSNYSDNSSSGFFSFNTLVVAKNFLESKLNILIRPIKSFISRSFGFAKLVYRFF